ncbi:unnamed protein product [Rhodiola kirilowii]
MSSGININLVMTVIGFAVSTTFIVFICARLLCTRMQLNASRQSVPIAMVSGFELSMLERGMQGLEASVSAKFPVKKYGDLYAKDEIESQCTICLAEYGDEDSLRFIPFCGHSFHKNCIDIWLRQHATCPICRTSVRDISDKKHVMQPMFSPRSQPHHIQGSHQMSPFHLC